MLARPSNAMLAGLWGLAALLLVCLGHPAPGASEALATPTACCHTSSASAVPATPVLVGHDLQIDRTLVLPNAVKILPSLVLSIYHPPEL